MIVPVRVAWSDEFRAWFDRIAKEADSGRVDANRKLDVLTAQFSLLIELAEPPSTDTAQLMRVRQHRRHTIWRVSHPFDRDVAVRLICWFPPDGETVVVVLFGGDKKKMGDAFYDSAGTRADAAIDHWCYQHPDDDEEDGDD